MSSPILKRAAAQKAKLQMRAMAESISVRNRPRAKRKLKMFKMESRVEDILQNAVKAKGMVQRPTGLVYDETMPHHCLWDDMHPGLAERFTRVLERCKELQLIERCQVISSRRGTKDEFMLLHTDEQYRQLEVVDLENIKEMSFQNDSIYLYPSTFDLSLLALGSTIDLIEQIVAGDVQNGMAIIRPPGHATKAKELNEYCFFNSVAAAAQYAVKKLKLSKILIVDWDVHHGYRTQRIFYNDPRVLYFSIHRFEHGTFWPNARESDFDAIGHGFGKGYNFNVPLNKTDMGNGDFMAIFQQILIPVAVEFQPELIIISAGYDAAIGCPEGEMNVTPAFYPHLLNPLMQLAQSRIAVIVEGGYCLDSLAEGAALTLRGLLGDPCPLLVEPLEPPCAKIQDAILNCIYAHRPYWKCMQLQSIYRSEKLLRIDVVQANLHKVSSKFVGGPPSSEPYATDGATPAQQPSVVENNLKLLRLLKAETKLVMPKVRVCYVYDDLMLQHTTFERGHPEQPHRIKKIYEMQLEYGLTNRMQLLPSRFATMDEICLVHTQAHANSIRCLGEKDELQIMSVNCNSVYFHPKTFECATLAAGCVLQVVDKVLCGVARCGVCIVRPPGHHAEADVPLGFCIFNNVAIAAQYAIREHGLKRVLIVDWDVHHGNGTQHIFESNPQVLYISIHRYDNGKFYPKSHDGNYDVVGKGEGVGFNVNIPWNKKGMGDMEYIVAFQQLIMPIAYEFDPQLVLVSAGFDAAIGDPLGGCNVTPEAYGLFTHWLSSLANGRIIICLEGGYNVISMSYAMTMCAKSLLGDPIPQVQATAGNAAYGSCVKTLQSCLAVQQRYWKSLVFNKRLPQPSRENNNEDILSAIMEIFNHNARCSAGSSHSVVAHASQEASGSMPKQ